MACKEEARHAPEGGGWNFVQDPEGGSASVACKGYPTKPGYLAFFPGGMYTINCMALDKESESNKDSRGDTKKIKIQSWECLKRPAQIIDK